MLRVSIDDRLLKKSVKRARKKFGDSNRQSVARLATQLARGLAVQTQPFGANNGKTKRIQYNAIMTDVWRVVSVEDRPNARGKMYFASPEKLDRWVEGMRTRRRGRTPEGVPRSKRAKASTETIRAAVKIRQRRAGIAKGGWIDAGKKAAKFQRGGKRLNIGKNFLSWTHRPGSGFGSAKEKGPPFRPFITIGNRARHVGSRHVLNPAKIPREIKWAAKKTLRWYEKALKRKLK